MTLKAKFLTGLVLTLVLLSVPKLVAAVQPALVQHPPALQVIDAYLESNRQKLHIPGLAVAIVKGDRVVYLKGFGIADPKKQSVTPDTPFILGSVSKSFTALAIMQLVDVGQINLDTPVQNYLPWFHVADSNSSAQITVRYLLNQISGISTWTGREQLTDNDTSDSALERHVRNLSTAHLTQPVGKVFQYSNANYVILGMIVQAVSGMPYEQYIQQHIFAPLEMQHSFTSQEQAQQATPPLAMGYRLWFDHPVVTEVPYNRGDLPAGYLISSTRDLAHYLIAHLNGGHYKDTAVVSSGGMRELHHPAVKAWEDTSYAMGWIIANVNGIPVNYHAGEVANFSTNLTLVPSEQWGVALLTNVYPGVMGSSIRKLYIGVVSLLVGRTPPVMTTNLLTQLQVIALPILLMLQLLGFFCSLVVLQRWRKNPKPVRLGMKFFVQHVGLPLVVDGAIAAGLLFGLPVLFDTPLPVMLFFQPDLIGIAMISAALALVWGLLRTGFSIWLLLRTSRTMES